MAWEVVISETKTYDINCFRDRSSMGFVCCDYIDNC